jgi:hypothetical protein
MKVPTRDQIRTARAEMIDLARSLRPGSTRGIAFDPWSLEPMIIFFEVTLKKGTLGIEQLRSLRLPQAIRGDDAARLSAQELFKSTRGTRNMMRNVLDNVMRDRRIALRLAAQLRSWQKCYPVGA